MRVHELLHQFAPSPIYKVEHFLPLPSAHSSLSTGRSGTARSSASASALSASASASQLPSHRSDLSNSTARSHLMSYRSNSEGDSSASTRFRPPHSGRDSDVSGGTFEGLPSSSHAFHRPFSTDTSQRPFSTDSLQSLASLGSPPSSRSPMPLLASLNGDTSSASFSHRSSFSNSANSRRSTGATCVCVCFCMYVRVCVCLCV